jgi:hypothetical protein
MEGRGGVDQLLRHGHYPAQLRPVDILLRTVEAAEGFRGAVSVVRGVMIDKDEYLIERWSSAGGDKQPCWGDTSVEGAGDVVEGEAVLRQPPE